MRLKRELFSLIIVLSSDCNRLAHDLSANLSVLGCKGKGAPLRAPFLMIADFSGLLGYFNKLNIKNQVGSRRNSAASSTLTIAQL